MKKFLKTKEDFLQYKYLNIPLNVDESVILVMALQCTFIIKD
jgi:hypothetical protein